MRVRRSGKTLLAVAAIALLATACGGSSALSAATYRDRAEAACRTQAATLNGLPTVVRNEHLTVAEADRIATRSGTRFVNTVRALKPPAALVSAHRTLIADLTAPQPATITTRTQLDALIAHDRHLIDDFRSLGLSGCAGALQTRVNQIVSIERHNPAF